jgi:hypothetical protein
MEVYRTNFGAIIRTKAPGVVVSEVDELIKRTDKLLFEVDKSLIDYSDSTPEQKQLDHWLLQEIDAVDTNHSLPESEMVRRNLLTYREYFSKSRELGIMSEEEYLEALQYLNDLEVDFGFAIANNGRSSNRLLTRIYGFVKDTAASVPNDTGRIGRIGKLSSEFARRVFDKGFGYVSKKLDDFGNFIDRHKKAAACFGAGVLLPVGAIVADVVLSSGCISKPVEKPKPPKPPVAVMDGNFACKSGESIFFNASKSYDPDGNITGYKWIFGDGNETDWLNEPTINHTYFYKGKFQAYGELIVKDNDNMTNSKHFYVYIAPVGDELFRYGGDAFWKSQYGDEFWKSRIYYDGMCIVGPESFQYNASLILAFMEKFVPQDYSFVKQHTKYFRWDKRCTRAFTAGVVTRTTDVSSCADRLIEDKHYILIPYARGFVHEAAHHNGANETLAYEIDGKCWDNITYALLKASGKFSESDIELYVNKSSPMNEQRYNQYYDLRMRMDYTINNMQGDFVKNFNFTDVARRKITYPKD